MGETSDEDRAPAPFVDPLGAWERAVSGLVAICGLSVGTIATFVTDNSVGSGMLIALGALFALVAVTGTPVTRARFGDNELTFGLRKALADAMEAEQGDVQVSVAEAVLDAPLPSSDPLRQRAQVVEATYDYEEKVRTALARLFPGESVIRQNPFRAPDFEIRHDGRLVGFETKFTRQPRSSAVRRGIETSLQVMHDTSRDHRPDVMVIVANSATPADHERVNNYADIGLVVWNSDADDGALRSEVERLLTPPHQG